MAMVLDAFASYIGDYLKQVVQDELGTMLGVSGEIEKLGDKLLYLKSFLADADRRNITDQTVQVWVGQLKRVMYEAADILDLCQLKAMERGSSSADAGCCNPLLFCMRNPFHAREIGTRIKALNQRLDSIKEQSAAFDFINLGSYEDRHRSKVHASPHGGSSRETSWELDRLSVVGDQIEEDTRTLVAQIMQTSKEVNGNIMVFAIVGVGGIGKTTLAQKVFSDEAVQGEFGKKIWLSINRNFNGIELLRRAIIEAGGDHRPVGDAKVALNRTLKEALVGHKTLLVMDDVWDHGAWEGVLKIPFETVVASGSRVLITTRDEGVARGMTATWPYHHVDTLGPDDAWSLLKKQVLSNEIDEDHINRLKDIGLKIIQKCGGLPLAVKVMGGLLRKRGELRRDWEEVLDESKWSITKMPQELNYAVYLSYEDMPPYLQQCFLYYSLLPHNRRFIVHQVVAMWISEGFIHGNSNDLEELGLSYYRELISRNLIEPDKFTFNQSTCTMHDVIRSFAQYMTKDESLIVHDGDIDILTKLNSQKFLRLSIETGRLESGEVNWKNLQEQQSVRTLISTIQIKMKPGDSLVTFSGLRTLHIKCADMATAVESLHKLKHLRYLALENTDISVLPGNIGKMKLLQFLNLSQCEKLMKLPNSIVKLGQLRLLNASTVSMIPRGFRSLTNMRRLSGFQAHMDGDWCSLDELGPLSQLRLLGLYQLENVSSASLAANARLGEKMYLIDLFLLCTSRLGDDGLVKEKEDVSEEEQQRIEKVFNELGPPPSVEVIHIEGYFGEQLPSWMMSTSKVSLNNLKFLTLSDLACCTQLPNGLCKLPYLQLLQVDRTPCIKRVGTEFLQAVVAPFPRLNKMVLKRMVEWEKWDWEEQVQAMPRLEEISLIKCKLRRVPPGLASNAMALKVLVVQLVQHLSYLENFPFVVELSVLECPNLERITNFRSLQKLTITDCPKLKVLESIPALERLALEDYAMEKLPEYMRDIKPKHLQLFCRLWLLSSVAAGQSGLEWDKFSHVEHVKAYAGDGNNQRKWYVLYTRRDNLKLDSNISSYNIFEETLSSSMVDAQGFESVYKMRRGTFSYICSLVRIRFFEDMMAGDHTFVDGRVLSLQDRVAVALRMLNSGEPPVSIGSSLGVNDSTVSMLTRRFVEVMWERAMKDISLEAVNLFSWPNSSKMEKIKHKFDTIYGLPNCCGVVHTTHITFGSENCDHEKNDCVLLQTVIDIDMRFTNIWLGPSGSMNQSSILNDSRLFKCCEHGTWLNGNKLKVSSGGGSEVGEYIIGDAGYPILPWLLTPYLQEDKDLSADFPPYQAEFNRRHSSASTATLAVLARFKDTWKILDREIWRSIGPSLLYELIIACCMLHNIVIDMEEEQEGEDKDQDENYMEEEEEEEEESEDEDDDEEQDENYIEQVQRLADEYAVRVRDALSQHLIETGVDTMTAEDGQEAVVDVSRSVDGNKEQQAHRRQQADRGKEKVHDS